MKIYTFILSLFSAFLISACSTTAPVNQTQNSANVATQTNQAAVETKPAPAAPARSPIETMKALHEAAKKKDPAEIKSYLSEGTLKLLEDSAQKQKQTVDELLKEDKAAPFHELPKILGEKIEGQTAIVEVEDSGSKEIAQIPFVIENGEWKVAIDKYLKNLEAEFEKESKQPAGNK